MSLLCGKLASQNGCVTSGSSFVFMGFIPMYKMEIIIVLTENTFEVFVFRIPSQCPEHVVVTDVVVADVVVIDVVVTEDRLLSSLQVLY